MDQEGNPAPEPAGIKRWLPLAVLVAAGIAAWLSGAHRYVSFHALEAHREWILAQVAALGVWAPLAFIALYATVAALSIPGATIMTLSGGFLFGTVLGTLFNVLGATIGATLVFLVARSAFGEVLHRRAGPFLKKVEAGFRQGPDDVGCLAWSQTDAGLDDRSQQRAALHPGRTPCSLYSETRTREVVGE